MAQVIHVLDGGGALHTAVPRTIVAFAVSIAFAVGRVVLLVVAHQFVHRKAVMGGNEVHGGDRAATVHLVQVGAAHQSTGEFRQRGRLRAPEITHAIAIASVPFRPAGREASHLIAAGTEIPWFGDELDAGDDRILFDDVEECG